MRSVAIFCLNIFQFKSRQQKNIPQFMFNHHQNLPFQYYSPFLDYQANFWPQSSYHYCQSLGNTNFQNHFYLDNQKFPIKIEENLQIYTQKSEKLPIQPIFKGNPTNFYSYKKRKQIKKQKNIEESQQQGKVIQRNQTKNISKNFGKAILTFAKAYTKFSQQLLRKQDVERQHLLNYVKKERKNLNSLHDLRQMWGAQNQKDKLKRCLRIISHHFMRKHCLPYIFNSRIKSLSAHTKYRHRLMQGMRRPSQFLSIKQN